jgi:hypothetical protein
MDSQILSQISTERMGRVHPFIGLGPEGVFMSVMVPGKVWAQSPLGFSQMPGRTHAPSWLCTSLEEQGSIIALFTWDAICCMTV